MKLSDEELRAVLERAEEIERESRHGSSWNAEVAAVISAGEEVGLSRDAVQRAEHTAEFLRGAYGPQGQRPAVLVPQIADQRHRDGQQRAPGR